ncbi:uncharacterized protein TNCV_4106031 [Trichonephila clavipes]|nr:uncharacterized protein TNCV_4106031 [Trichonephila clavipes]
MLITDCSSVTVLSDADCCAVGVWIEISEKASALRCPFRYASPGWPSRRAMAFFPDKAAARNVSDDDLLLRQMTSLGCPPEDLGYHTLPPDDESTWGKTEPPTTPLLSPVATQDTDKLVATFKGITPRFLIYEIPLDISLNEIAKELQEINDFEIIEMRRFIKTGSQQQFSPILITILGSTLLETVKLWLINHRIQNFIDKPRQCTTCFSFLYSARFCQKTAININCGVSHSGQCSSNSRYINCKGDHHANSLNCPEYIKDKKILELKCEQHLILGDARRFRDNKRASYSAVIQTNAVNLYMQDYLEKKLEDMLTSFQAILEKQTS